MPRRSLSTSTTQLVVTCVDRKAARPRPEFMLRNHVADSVAGLATSWLRALHRAHRGSGDDLPAGDLYRGEQWAVVRSLASSEVAVWILSAGYGLIPGDVPIRPYGATFAVGHVDSVARFSSSDGAAWWERLTRWDGPRPGQPRTLQELLGATTGPVLLAASPAYLSVLGDDLSIAAEEHQTRLSVVSSAQRLPGAADRVLAPIDGRLRQVLGGSMVSLNVRVARAALGALAPDDLSPPTVRDWVSRLTAEVPPLEAHQRARLTDDEVLSFIRNARQEVPGVSCSAAHRLLRDRGMACEQSRFRELYRRVTS